MHTGSTSPARLPPRTGETATPRSSGLLAPDDPSPGSGSRGPHLLLVRAAYLAIRAATSPLRRLRGEPPHRDQTSSEARRSALCSWANTRADRRRRLCLAFAYSQVLT